MKDRFFTLCIFVALLGITVLPLTAGEDGMKLLITLDRDSDYDGGDTGKITVHVFEKGEYADSDEIPDCILKGGYYYDDEGEEREIELEKKSTGIYGKEFKVYDSDADDFNIMSLTAEATYGKSDESDTEYDMDDESTYIYIEQEAEASEEVDVKVKGVPNSLSPGDSVTIGIEVRKGTELTDADELDVTYQLEYGDGEYADEKDLPYSKGEDGTYEVVLEIPEDVKESGDIGLVIEATIGEEDDTLWDLIDLDLLSVWYHEDTIGESICKFDIYVADVDGTGVSDAEIKIDWETDEGESGDDTELTGDSGKAAFEIIYDDDTTELEVSGNVKTDGKTQYFSGTIEIGESEDEEYVETPSMFGLDIITNSEPLSGKSPFKLECTAYMEGQRISNEDVYYYLYSKTDIITHGAATTDVDGEFSITFSYEPSGVYDSIYADFEAISGDYTSVWFDDRENTVDGKDYEIDSEYIFFEGDSGYLDLDFDDSSVKIEVGKLQRGGLTSVTVKGIPAGNEPLISWIPSEVNSIQDVMDWQESYEWDSWGGDGLSTQNMQISDDEISCTLMIPEFMPTGKYTVVAGYIEDFNINEDYSLDEFYHMNNVVVKPGQAGSSETTESSFVESTGFMMIIIGVVFLVLAIITIAIIIGIRKKKKGEAKSEWSGDHSNLHLESNGSIPDRTEDGYPQPAAPYPHSTDNPSPTDAYPPPADTYLPPGVRHDRTHGNLPRPPMVNTPAFEQGTGWDDETRNSGQWPEDRRQTTSPPPYPPQGRREYPPPPY